MLHANRETEEKMREEADEFGMSVPAGEVDGRNLFRGFAFDMRRLGNAMPPS